MCTMCNSSNGETIPMDPVLKSEDLTVDLRDGTKRPLVITKAIGQGSFGTVWKGIIAENIAVAVKQTRRTSKQAVAEFEKEIAIMQHLQSEYIVRVYGSVTLDSSLLIVMEYIGLGSLAELVDRNYLSPRMRMMYALHVCRGMKYLHAMKVIHRDLKPGNVLCVSNNIEDPVLCKITDFGASRVTDQDSTATFTMTKGIGSPFYMSPEMLRNDKQYTRAIDVYSFAIMCVELWNLQLPFSEHDFESAVGLFPCPFLFSPCSECASLTSLFLCICNNSVWNAGCCRTPTNAQQRLSRFVACHARGVLG